LSNLSDELYSLLVPLVGERLLVPRACVAEVIGFHKSKVKRKKIIDKKYERI